MISLPCSLFLLESFSFELFCSCTANQDTKLLFSNPNLSQFLRRLSPKQKLLTPIKGPGSVIKILGFEAYAGCSIIGYFAVGAQYYL